MQTRTKVFPIILGWLMALNSASAATASAAPVPQQTAQRLFQRLTGVPLGLKDPRLAQMTNLVQSNKVRAAAAVALSDDHFYNITLMGWAIAMSNKAESPFDPFNDFAAMIVGVTHDDLDARTLLSGNFTYVGRDPNLPSVAPTGNDHYAAIESGNQPLQTALMRQEPQRPEPGAAAGLLSSRAWGASHLSAGTNRRALQFTFQEFLCAPIATWKDPALSDYHVRRDVTRAPGNDPATYEGVCRACHAPMDAMDGAYAKYDFIGDQVQYFGDYIAPKMNKNAQNYPDGWAVVDATWTNPLATSPNAPDFGWRGSTSGEGLSEFGAMIANAKGFSRCLARRVFSQVCNRDPGAADAPGLEQAATAFESSGYKIKQLFVEVATLPPCLGADSVH